MIIHREIIQNSNCNEQQFLMVLYLIQHMILNEVTDFEFEFIPQKTEQSALYDKYLS